jgi:F-type H+-transporting ATPase subunit delta
MSANPTMARPYARAAFELARDAGQLPAWGDKLAFAAAVAEHPDVRGVIGNPRYGADALKAIFMPEGESADSAFAAFVGMLVDNRRLALLPEIAAGYAALRREHERVLKVVVRAAVPLDAPQANAIRTALTKRFDRAIEMETVVDPGVIGGAVIDAGEIVIDGSVRGRLQRLAQALTA